MQWWFPGGHAAEHPPVGGGRGESGPVGSASENITASRLSAVALFSGVTSATVDWNRDQFCENSTTLFTVSESGVY